MGVYYNTKTKKYEARIRVKGKSKRLGSYKTSKCAKIAYQKAEQFYGNERFINKKLSPEEKRQLSNSRKMSWYNKHRDRICKSRREQHHQNKLMVFEYYGNTCKCCGESNHEFLTIDHINGGGIKHRKEIGNSKNSTSSTAFYTWLIKNNYPKEFQILCFNCNCAKSNHECCPHQKENLDESIYLGFNG